MKDYSSRGLKYLIQDLERLYLVKCEIDNPTGDYLTLNMGLKGNVRLPKRISDQLLIDLESHLTETIDNHEARTEPRTD